MALEFEVSAFGESRKTVNELRLRNCIAAQESGSISCRRGKMIGAWPSYSKIRVLGFQHCEDEVIKDNASKVASELR
jgi:hypothetical protein